ncbi:MAG: arginine decarboxylase [Bacteroidetes bacterium MED-G17]|nr:MAG: arginine decarboxylase [Bacteroidetes bacterium TMED39]PDH53522.1 MAG: arginine decarboxylase [Bacteroidetes bacterium MED-G17]
MKKKYIHLVEQTFEFPQNRFSLDENFDLLFENINLKAIAKKYGTPLKITYLNKIGEQIEKSRMWFQNAINRAAFSGTYHYCYCTKSSHFKFVLEEVLSHGAHIETSSAFDMVLIENLRRSGKLNLDKKIICNGYKTAEYLNEIARFLELGYNNLVVVLDNKTELNRLKSLTRKPIKLGIRIASEEEPKFAFYTSRLGIGYKDILPYYKLAIEDDKQVSLQMLHFFINTGIHDTAYYWNELRKALNVYTSLAKVCSSVNDLNIGGGLPIPHSLKFNFEYAEMVNEIVLQIKTHCSDANIQHPDIYTEFGSFTVGESGLTLFKVLKQKQQNDRERWNLIDGSFMTTLPDTWAINKRFILFPLNAWDYEYERVLLGGLTCDSDDYYNSEQHTNAIYLPKLEKEDLYIGFFNTGAYQESLSGYGGIQHCLIPYPKHLLMRKLENGDLDIEVFREAQQSTEMLKTLGYD